MREHILHLAVPSALGVLGFLGTYATIARAIKPVEVLAINETVHPGWRVTEQSLVVVSLPGQSLAMRRNMIPAGERGIVLDRRVVRKIEANQILLFSDLDDQAEAPTVPDHCELVQISLERLPCRRELLRSGVRVSFVIRPSGDRSPTRIGPFDVFEGPGGPGVDGPGDPPARAEASVGVLLDHTHQDQVDALREALSRDALRAIEIDTH